MKIGLTGGIASGKSTVADYLEQLGATVLDADKIAHRLMEPQQEAWQKVVEYFGEEILLTNKQIDRNKLGEIIFNDPNAKEKLDQLTHPIIIKEIEESLKRLEQKKEIIIVEVPLLIEAGMEDLFEEVWLVYLPREAQIERLMARNNLDYQAAVARVESQMPLAEKKDYADLIINNDLSEQELKEELRQLWNEINLNNEYC
ncbi:dephospho-CoA kinase [Natroniella sulfidigena]|uniref:dephospho-CoA kinase n=1 Tax=Natroniella sulfidigena TaxID=723921 RepID=UPI002009F219|nr:dephospho-CoA kinase [Natroniella sulfidigena]MCK8815796.1 dephospho-CoA kinase [Natroniella sulfidigena]